MIYFKHIFILIKQQILNKNKCFMYFNLKAYMHTFIHSIMYIIYSNLKMKRLQYIKLGIFKINK